MGSDATPVLEDWFAPHLHKVEVNECDDLVADDKVLWTKVAMFHPHLFEAGADTLELLSEIRDRAHLVRALACIDRQPFVFLPDCAVCDVHTYHGGQVYATRLATLLEACYAQEIGRLGKKPGTLSLAARVSLDDNSLSLYCAICR